jgi:hypothetical protein
MEQAGTVPVMVVGLGPIGQRLARGVLARTGLRLVGAADVALDKVGQQLDLLLGREMRGPLGMQVSNASAFDRAPGGGVALLATGSRLAEVAPQIRALVDAGWDVLSTCEELAYASASDASLARGLDEHASAVGRTVVGAGINPGFLLDVLPLVLSGACTRVETVRVRRVVDTNARRLPLQEKAGVGLTAAEFSARRRAGSVGHVGLRQSAFLLASSLGFSLDSFEERLEPVIAGTDTSTGLGIVAAGGVIGQHQVASGCEGGRQVVHFDLTMAAGAAPTDEIDIDGTPPLRCVLEGGVNGDVGTEAVVVNLVPVVAAAPPGLLSVADLLPMRCRT